jgi:hypothetical protein
MDSIRAERAHDIHGEKRQPAQDEAADDDAQRLRRFGLHAKSLHLRIILFHVADRQYIFNIFYLVIFNIFFLVVKSCKNFNRCSAHIIKALQFKADNNVVG